MKANNHEERHKLLSVIGQNCKAWRISKGLRLIDIACNGVSIQSLSNFEYGFNDSVLALECYRKAGYDKR